MNSKANHPFSPASFPRPILWCTCRGAFGLSRNRQSFFCVVQPTLTISVSFAFFANHYAQATAPLCLAITLDANGIPCKLLAHIYFGCFPFCIGIEPVFSIKSSWLSTHGRRIPRSDTGPVRLLAGRTQGSSGTWRDTVPKWQS